MSNPSEATLVCRDGEWVEANYVRPCSADPWAEGLHSEALAVMPRQVSEATELLKSRGVTTDFDTKGRPIFTSRTHRRRHCEALGVFDKNGGYGDPQQK